MTSILYPYGVPITLAKKGGGRDSNKGKGNGGIGAGGPGGGRGSGNGGGVGGGGKPPTGGSYGPSTGDLIVHLAFDGSDGATTTTDEATVSPVTWTFNNNAQIDTAQSVFGGSSLLLNGDTTVDYLSASSSAKDLSSTQPWTLQTWIRFKSGTRLDSSQVIASKWDFTPQSNQAWLLSTDAASTSTPPTAVAFDVRLSGGGYAPTTFPYAFSFDTWYYLEVSHNGSHTYSAWVDGVFLNSDFTNALNNQTSTNPILIGAIDSTTIDFALNGWLDDFRIIEGVQHHTPGENYTPPTSAHTVY